MEATKRVQQEEYCGLVLTYRVNDTLLCVPVEHVESVIEPPAITEIPHAPDYVLGAFMHRGQTALALSLRQLLRLPPATESKTRKESLLVIWMGDRPIGYWVDEIKGMTDSNRGHWSAVPALIRDQGITKALVCDGQVYFPLDLTHSNQFKEISRSLEAFEKNKLHSVSQEVVEEISEAPPPGQTTVEQQDLDVTQKNRLAEPVPEADARFAAAQRERLEEQTDTTGELVSAEDDVLLEPKQLAESVDSEQAIAAVDDDYIVADYPADDSLEEGYEDQIEATVFAEHEIDTTALARAMQTARFTDVAVTRLQQVPEVQFDTNGQGDAFFELIAAAEAKYAPVAAPDDISDEMNPVHFIAEAQVDGFDESYQALLVQDALDAAVGIEPEEQIEAAVFAEPEIDITALALAMQAARFAVAKPVPLHQITELQFDAHGQADAFYDLIADAEAKYGPVEVIEDISDEMNHVHFMTEAQVDGFDESYQALLAQDARDAAVNSEFKKLIDDPGCEVISDTSLPDELNLTEEPYSFLPTSLPEDDEQILLDESIDDVVDESLSAELRQTEIDATFINDEGVLDESIYDEPTLDDLSLTEEPYSFLPTTLPEDDEQVLLDEETDSIAADDELVLDEDIYDEPTLNDLSLTEEPYSFIPTSLPEDDFDAAVETDELPAQQNQPFALLPHLIDDAADNNECDDDSSIKADSSTSERPVIALSYKDDKQTALPDFDEAVSKTDYYADKMAQSLKESTLAKKPDGHSAKKAGTEAKNIPPEDKLKKDKPKAPTSADIYKFKIPQLEPEDKTPEPTPSLGGKYVTPQLDSTGMIIRPDGQINKSFGLVKVFTIILATSTAGSWWFRDELFYREYIRKEMPSILQNEVAFLYSNRVTIESYTRGIDRMVINTPDQEIKVIRRNHVNPALLRERRKKEVTIHRVKKGDTLWSIAERYLDDPYRYEELAENSRIHNPDMIRPGDVVKITTKPTNTDK